MLPMRLLRARRKSGGSRAVARVRFPFRTAPLFAGTPLRCKGPPGRFRGFGGASAVPAPCPVLRAPLRLRHPHPVLRASLRRRVFFCGSLCDFGIRTLSCGLFCGCGTCALLQFPLRHVRPAFGPFCVSCFAARSCNAVRMPPSSLLAARVCVAFLASAARLPASLRRPGFPPRSCTPVSLQLRSRRTGPPGPDPPAARAAPHSGRRRGIAALPGLFRFGGRCESSVIIRKCAGDGIVE